MQIEMAIIAIIIFYIFINTGKISISKLVADNEIYLRKLKESDYDFYVKARYVDSVNSDILFSKRLQNSLIIIFVVFILLLNKMSYAYFLGCIIIGFLFFKWDYTKLKNYYRRHLHEIDTMLPY